MRWVYIILSEDYMKGSCMDNYTWLQVASYDRSVLMSHYRS